MRPGKTLSAEEVQVVSRFEGLREILASDQYVDHLDRPLAYWALPTDRRLPLAFLSRTLRDLLRTPFNELAATPGIGQKKMSSFVQLLARAANTDPSELPVEPSLATAFGKAASSNGSGNGTGGFDPANVSEVVWSQWRASVVKHGLGDRALGRFAPSLKGMTRVIWNTPMSAYTDCTLDEIRHKKTHGEKRVRAILEVFYAAHTLVGAMGRLEHLVVRIIPRRIDQVEQWISGVLQQPGVPTEQEIFDCFVSPLLEQVRLDATQQIASLAENRLGITGPITSVRQAARSMGLTRARVYQLLNEINDILTVRWPNGRHQVYELRDRFESESAEMDDPPELDQFHAAIELFYPGNRRGAAGPLEQTSMMVDEEETPLHEEVEAVA